VPVAGDIEAVAGHAVEAELPGGIVPVDGEGGAGQGGGAEGQDIEAFAAVGEALAVALILFDVGEEVVGGEDGLSALQVRVAGQDEVAVMLGSLEEGALEVEETGVEGIAGVACPEFDGGDDLIVTAAGGVELAPEVAEPVDESAFDVRVD